MLSHNDTELFLDFVRSHFILVGNQPVELDAVLVIHLDAVGVLELQTVPDIAHCHQARQDLFVKYVFDVAAIYFNTLPENILMRLGGTDIALHPARHGFGTQNQIGYLFIDELDQAGVDFLRVGHGESLDFDFVFQPCNDDLVLGGVGNLIRQPFAVGVAFRHTLSHNDGLPVGMAEIHVVRHGELLGKNQGRSCREKP